MNKGKLLILFGGFLLLVTVILGFYIEANMEIEQGDCYDRFRSKINDVTCDVEVYPFPPFLLFYIGTLGILSLGLGVLEDVFPYDGGRI